MTFLTIRVLVAAVIGFSYLLGKDIYHRHPFCRAYKKGPLRSARCQQP